jgi:hypothetical protein
MRSILLDELLEPEIDAVIDYLDRQARPSGIEGLYWLPLTRELWNETQLQGWEDESWTEGGDYRFAVEVGPAWVRFELLVRSESLLNIGGGQADERQALFVLRWADDMARKLNLLAASG